jgi:hypothetical protein
VNREEYWRQWVAAPSRCALARVRIIAYQRIVVAKPEPESGPKATLELVVAQRINARRRA